MPPGYSPANYYNDAGDLIIEKRTLFRKVGWQGYNDHRFYTVEDYDACKQNNRGGFGPVYALIATDNGNGWED